MILPDGDKRLIELAKQLTERCRVSQARRASMYRDYQMWAENGTLERRPATANLLYGHVDRLGSHLNSPSDLRFVIDTESEQPKDVMQRCNVAARVLSREWERSDIDIMFALGVVEALKYGCVLPKLIAREWSSGNERKVELAARLVMPWNFGVLNESVNSLTDQEAVCETVFLTRYEVMRRVRYLPDGESLYKRIVTTASPDSGVGGPDGFMHQVLLGATSAPVNQSAPMQAPGLVDVGGNQYPTPTVEVAEDLYPMHELWVKDDDQGDDWVTIQYIEPDIMIAPRTIRVNAFRGAGEAAREYRMKRKNIGIPDTLPYGYICPNVTPGRFWGRSELQDLMEPQKLLTGVLDDYRRLMAIQFDKLIAFVGFDGLTDEAAFVAAKNSGYFNLPPGASANDLTPKIPPEALPFVQYIVEMMERISGFSGKITAGEPAGSVRSDSQANTMIRMATPRLRDRSLLIERQEAAFADISLAALEAKEARVYWVDPEDGGKSDFLMSQLPDDRRVSVDAHSTSPIYHDDMSNLMLAGFKAGYVTPESMIEYLPYQHKDVLLQRYKEKAKAQQELMQQHPEFFARGGMRSKRKPAV